MPEFKINNLRNDYIDLVYWVANEGDHIAPRGMHTREIRGALVELTNPYDALPVGVNRGVSLGIAAIEACQLLGGVATPDLLVKVAPQFKRYAEPDGSFHGAYGARITGQYEKVVERLRADPDTRQAVVTIWNPALDLQPGKLDYPCTLTHTFQIRKGKLEMRVHMRSNDVMKGVGYDYWQFTRVQIAMASVLGIEVGSYFHYADSLHLYESDLPALDRLTYADPEADLAFELLPAITGTDWGRVEWQARDALSIAASGLSTRELKTEAVRWNVRAMRDAIARNTDA